MSKEELNNTSNDAPSTFTLPKSIILRGKRNFDRLFTRSERISAPFIVLRYAVYEDAAEGFQVGFISKKKLGTAVQRNRIRRHMREAYRLNQDIISDLTNPSGIGLHMAFMAQKADASFEEIQHSVVTLLNQLRKRLSQPQS